MIAFMVFCELCEHYKLIISFQAGFYKAFFTVSYTSFQYICFEESEKRAIKECEGSISFIFFSFYFISGIFIGFSYNIRNAVIGQMDKANSLRLAGIENNVPSTIGDTWIMGGHTVPSFLKNLKI